jgi:hypothetical protein
MSKMICMCLGRRCSISGTGHFSRASCIIYVTIALTETIQGSKSHGKYGVVGEEEGVRNNRPRAIPRKVFFIKKDAHELHDG